MNATVKMLVVGFGAGLILATGATAFLASPAEEEAAAGHALEGDSLAADTVVHAAVDEAHEEPAGSDREHPTTAATAPAGERPPEAAADSAALADARRVLPGPGLMAAGGEASREPTEPASPEEAPATPGAETSAADSAVSEGTAALPARPTGTTDAAGAAAAGPAGGTGAGTAAAAGAAEPAGEPAARVARILRSMRTRAAAQVLEGLDDERIREILSHLSERQVADLLAALPADRAAGLVRGTLTPPPAEPPSAGRPGGGS